MNVHNDSFHSTFTKGSHPENLDALKEFENFEQSFKGLGDLIGLAELKQVNPLNFAKMGRRLAESHNKFFYHIDEKGTAICRDLKTFIADQPRKSLQKALRDLEQQIKDSKIFFGQKVKMKDTKQDQYIIHESHVNNFSNDVVHKTLNPQNNTIQTTTSPAGNHTVNAMSMGAYMKMTSLVLSRIQTLSTTLLQYSSSNINAQQDHSLVGRVSNESANKRFAKQSIKNLMQKSIETQREARTRRHEERIEEQQFQENRDVQKRKRIEKDAKHEKLMENFEKQDESKALKKGESVRTGRPHHTRGTP